MSIKDELSWQEERIYKLLVNEGLDLVDIGKRLGLKRSTVNTYMVRIYQKFGVSKQKDLIINYYKNLLKEVSNESR